MPPAVAEIGPLRGANGPSRQETRIFASCPLDKRGSPDKTIAMTPAFDRFVAPARRRPQLWRFGLGTAARRHDLRALDRGVIVVAYFLLAPDADPLLWTDALAAAETPGGTLLLLLTFVGMALGPMAAARWLHGRSAGSLFGPRVRTLRDFVVAAAIVFVVLGLSLGLWSLEYDAVPNLPAWRPGRCSCL
jgi:uncharacterized protein